jgi:uncharacterized membrane protein YccC
MAERLSFEYWSLLLQTQSLYENLHHFKEEIMATLQDVLAEVAAVREAAIQEKTEVRAAFTTLENKVTDLEAAIAGSPSAPDLQPVLDELIAAKNDIAGIFVGTSAVDAVPAVDPATVEPTV